MSDYTKQIAAMDAVFRTFPPAIARRMAREYADGIRAVEQKREAARREREAVEEAKRCG